MKHFIVAMVLSACAGNTAEPIVQQQSQAPTPSQSASSPSAPPPVSATSCEALTPREVPLTLHTFPEDGEAPYVSALRSASNSIDVMVYMMGYGGILDTLLAKAKAGVRVQVILDGNEKRATNQKYFDALTEAGAKVVWSDPDFTYMHAKVLLVDDAVAVISTGNYSKSFMLKERNYAVTDRDPQDIAALRTLFAADLTQAEPKLECTRLLVAPLNAKARLIALVESATSELVIESMQFAERDIQKAVLARKAAGVVVRVLVADSGWITTNVDAAKILNEAAIPVRELKAPTVHVKAIVVDGKRAYLGSENLSYTSLAKNREVGIMTEQPEVVEAMRRTFEADWSAGQAL